MSLQTFFESQMGQVISIAIMVVIFLGVLFAGKKEKNTTQTMVISALLVALSIALNQISIFQMPQGGSVSLLGMLPIVICAYFFGTRRALMCGMCIGMLDLILKPFVIHPVQMFLDYPLAFGALGFAGIVFAIKKDAIIPAYIIGVFFRYAITVVSGTVFFGVYAPKGFSAFTWSIWYNITYIGIEAALTIAILSIPQVRKAFIKLKSQLY